jgi:RNA polymerase sigma factor (sigma-70 family)
MNVSDEVLVLACRRGDEKSWETLVDRYQRLIYAIARRAGLDEDASADVFQNVFATLVEKLDRIEQPDRLQAWLVTTAKRETWRTVAKQRVTRPPASDTGEADDPFDKIPADSPLPDEEIQKLQEQHAVRMALGALDDRCNRLLTVLFYTSEPLPYSEVAVRLGVSVGSIGPTRARCLQKLLRILRDAGFP